MLDLYWANRWVKSSYKNADGGAVDALQTADVDGLGIIAQPVAKVDTLDVHGAPFLAVQKRKTREHVLDVWPRLAFRLVATCECGARQTSMSPVEAFYLRWIRYIAIQWL